LIQSEKGVNDGNPSAPHQRATDTAGLSDVRLEAGAACDTAVALILSSKALAEEKTLACANGPLATRDTSSCPFATRTPIGVENDLCRCRTKSRNWDGVASPTDRTTAY